jgi:hypothetical protein
LAIDKEEFDGLENEIAEAGWTGVPDDDVLNTTDELLEQMEDTAKKTDANLMWREVFSFLGNLIQKKSSGELKGTVSPV